MSRQQRRIGSIGINERLKNGSSIWSTSGTSTMDPRTLTNEFKEFLRLLNENDVDYLVVGGHAVAFHGYPHSTRSSGRFKDLTDLEKLP